MNRTAYDRYLARVNRCDATAFDDYMTPDALMVNGTLKMRGVAAIQDHYVNRIWPLFEETVNVERFVLDGSTLAARPWTHFLARNDAETVFGAVKKGEMFDYRGLVMYEIVGGRFARTDTAQARLRSSACRIRQRCPGRASGAPLAPVNEERLPGDERGIVGGEERDHAGLVLRRAVALDALDRGDVPEELIRQGLLCLGRARQARRDAAAPVPLQPRHVALAPFHYTNPVTGKPGAREQ